MPRQPIDYATPNEHETPPVSRAEKWTLIVLGLIFVTVVAFLFLFVRYVMSIGPLDGH